MKKIISLLVFSFAFSSFFSQKINNDCTLKEIPIYGKVKIVDGFADFNVKIVENFSDIKVKIVTDFPDECGEWQFVDSFPDFTIKFVDNFPDFTVKFVDSFSGLK
ncbi:MAG: hypothetical protein LBE36_04990 [Flavobacteriaceae bacterium]|jgi:hypothetical protein|nr:hypothetical protein [Flavobacteriaceae bacterium]